MTTTTSIEHLLVRLLDGDALSPEEQAALFASRDLLGLGMAADDIRRRRHGTQVTFVRVADVPADRAAEGDVSFAGRPGEIRVVGVPRDLAHATAAVSAAVAVAGDVPVTAFALGDLAQSAGGSSAVDWLSALKHAGLSAIAEAAVDDLRPGDSWLTAAGAAALPIARLIVGRAADSDRQALFSRVASLLEAHPALEVFAPLPRPGSGGAPSTGYDDVRLVALARLLLPVPHIQVDWQRYGPKLAQVALTFGADDLDGVSPEDEVGQGRRRSPLEEIRRNILAASGVPAERAALFSRRS